MTISAQGGDAVAERIRRRTLNVMDAVTIGTSWNIRVARSQCRAMDARLVGVIDRAVTLGTGQRDRHARFWQKLHPCSGR